MARYRTKPVTAVAPTATSPVHLAMKMIESRACDGLTVKQILRELGISRLRLEREFEAQLGKMPGQMLKLVRLNRAKDLLIGTDLPIKQVARQIGYQRSSNFCDFFLTNTGQSPSEFRSAGAARLQDQKELQPPASAREQGMPRVTASPRATGYSSEGLDFSGPLAWPGWVAMSQVDVKPELISFGARQFGMVSMASEPVRPLVRGFGRIR